MNKAIQILALFICLFIVETLGAQQKYNLDLETSILLAKEKSRNMRILRTNMKKAVYELKAATSSFKTQISMDFTLPRYTETIRQWEDSSGISFYPIRQNMISSGLNISQPLPTDGRISIRSGFQNYIDYYGKDRNIQINSTIGIQQPITALFGYNRFKLNYQQVKLNYERSVKSLKREELNIIYSVSSEFYNLLLMSEKLKISRQALTRQRETFNIAQNKYKAGLIREVEALQMDVDLATAINDFESDSTNYVSQMNFFKETIGIELRDSIVLDNEIQYKEVIVDENFAVQMALDNRLEIQENEIQLKQALMEIKRQKAEGRISGDFNFNYNFIGVDKSSLSTSSLTSVENSWNDLVNRPGSFGVGLSLRLPILDWGANKARIKSAEITLEQTQIQMEDKLMSIEREIRNVVSRFKGDQKKLQLLEKTIKIAETSFEISRKRYAIGDIDSQAMALERERLNNTYISRLNAYISQKLLLSDLMRKTFYDFERKRSMLTE